MKRVVFIITHHESGHQVLESILNNNQRVQCFNTKIDYDHPDSLETLFDMKHKLNNSAAIYSDTILTNPQLSSESFFGFAKFIYLVRDAKSTLNLMSANSKYSELGAFRYYTFRLRRIAEMAPKTPGAIFLTWRNIEEGKGLHLIEDYLQLKEPLIYEGENALYEDVLPIDTCNKAQDVFERYLYYLRHQDLRKVQ